MIDRNYFSHSIPGYGKVWDKLNAIGYCYNVAGENIGWNNYPDDIATAAIQQAFMDSAGHRANIMGKAWDVIGIGAYKGPTGKKMWTVLFADKCGSTAPKPTPKPTTRPKADPTADPEARAQGDAAADPEASAGRAPRSPRRRRPSSAPSPRPRWRATTSSSPTAAAAGRVRRGAVRDRPRPRLAISSRPSGCAWSIARARTDCLERSSAEWPASSSEVDDDRCHTRPASRHARSGRSRS